MIKSKEELLREVTQLSHLLRIKYHVSQREIVTAMGMEQFFVPVTIFVKKLSPFESIVKFMKENEGKKLSEIGKLTGRTTASVWQTYRHAQEKVKSVLKPKETAYLIPLDVIKEKKFSILESIVIYLKDNFDLTYRAIGKLLQRNERTVWTVYQKGKKRVQ